MSPLNRRREPQIAVGLGRYGHPVLRPSSTFRKATLIVGTSRSGKTRLASSLANQQTMLHGGGQLVIDFKGDRDVVAAKARLAEKQGRPFHHFTFADKAGGRYEQVHPYAPDASSRYDPLARGNGNSKTSMLLNSVSHEGDAAVYLQTARELSELCWNIAALTGYDKTVGADGTTRISALEVLMNMLTVSRDGELVRQATALNADTICADNPHLARRDVEDQIRMLQSRAQSAQTELNSKNSVLASAAANTRNLVSSYVNSSALYPGTFGTSRNPAEQVDLVRAVLRGEIVVFSLNAQYYQDFAEMIGAMILLDLQNAVSTLRSRKQEVASFYGTTAAADATPWPPFIVQIEELGTAANDASAEALINLLNKSADTGLRVIVSTQSLADIRRVDDGKGVWLDQLLSQIDHLLSLQVTDASEESICGFSGQVSKQFATNEIDVSNNRLRMGTGASEAKKVRGAEQKETRIPPGAVQDLDYGKHQLVYITKAPKLTAVHTTAPEGPNNWYEVLEYVPVDEPPHPYAPFDVSDEDKTAAFEAARRQAQNINIEVADPQSVLGRIVGTTATNLRDLAALSRDGGTAMQPHHAAERRREESIGTDTPDQPGDEHALAGTSHASGEDDDLWGNSSAQDQLWD
ncbi:MAG: type IV secretory system conjugative DNA transfer family protein [Tomitella sp.]|nr:type IV secretory system conjugative DNA transfer family protein [Tomitella sp.]